MRRMTQKTMGCLVGCAIALSLWVPCAGAQSGQATLDSPGLTPLQLARDAVANELLLINYGKTFLRYRIHIKDEKGDQVRDVIETRDGTVARLIERDEHPLSASEDAGEQARLQAMLDSPDEFKRHIQKDASGKKLAMDIVKMLPDAMLFSFTPGQPQRADKPGGTAAELVIDFKPNPVWKPPTMASQALTGLEGRCWLDAKTHHLTRLEADLFQGVNFGFGIFAHLFPGGKFELEQRAVGEGRWIVERFRENVTVRAMMVKTIKQKTDLFASDFAPIPSLCYQDAIHMLLAGTARVHAKSSGEDSAAVRTFR
jgi:hypothetical protein